jgi:TetR/AcrR family transcriptional repressor of mexJK operon
MSPSSNPPAPPAPVRRSGRKRQAILDAATSLFLRQGYRHTSMDEIAALAAVSKQTVYKHFHDKEGLVAAILLAITERAGQFAEEAVGPLYHTENLSRDLGDFALRYATIVLQPQQLQVRRLVIGEAGRLPDLARAYYERAPARTLTALASCLRHLAGRKLLRVADAELAAEHFAFLIFGMPLDRAMFIGTDEGLTPEELQRRAREGVRVFLAGYRY